MSHIDSLYLLTVPSAVLAVAAVAGFASGFLSKPITRQASLIAVAATCTPMFVLDAMSDIAIILFLAVPLGVLLGVLLLWFLGLLTKH